MNDAACTTTATTAAEDRLALRMKNLAVFKQVFPAHKFDALLSLKPAMRLSGDASTLYDGDNNPVTLPVTVDVPDAIDSEYGRVYPGALLRMTAAPMEYGQYAYFAAKYLDDLRRAAGLAEIKFRPEPIGHKSYFLIVFGVATGKHLLPLVQATGATNVLIVERDLEFVWHSLDTTDWQAILLLVQSRGGRVGFIEATDPAICSGLIWRNLRHSNVAGADGTQIYVRHYVDFARETLNFLRHDFGHAFDALGFFHDEHLMLWNYCQNSKTEAALQFHHMMDKHRAAPAIVVGCGPSLDADLEFLKMIQDKAVIISCGSALRPLLANGIRPDFQIEIENIKVSPLIEQIADEFGEGAFDSIVLVAASTVDPKITGYFKSVIFQNRFTTTPFPLFSGDVKSTMQLVGPTVVNAGANFAYGCGFQKIIFFGCDQGIKPGGEHHSRHAYHYTPDAIEAPAQHFNIEVPANFGGTVLTSRGLYQSKGNLEALIRGTPMIEWINCSDGAKIVGAATHGGTVDYPERGLLCLDSAEPKDGIVTSILFGSDVFEECPEWPGERLAPEISKFIGAIRGVLRDTANFKVKSYLTRIASIVEPLYGFVQPPPKSDRFAAIFLTRGDILIMLVILEYYLKRVEDESRLAEFGNLAAALLIKRLDQLESVALRYVGEELLEPQAWHGATAHLSKEELAREFAAAT